jgi:large subunit ribosomal protein L24
VLVKQGACLGQSGKVLEVDQKKAKIKVDGLGVTKKHQKPSQQNRSGGIVEGLRWWPASKFQVCDSAGKAMGRVSFRIDGGKKERQYSKVSKKK